MTILLTLLAMLSSVANADTNSYRKTLEKLVEANTTNPPGNEAKAVEIIAARLKEAKIPYEITEFGPGRKNIYARLKGNGSKKPLLLIAHTDVVTAQNQPWTSDPHKVTEKDGYLIGRGVADDLGMVVSNLETFIALKKSNLALNRDVIFAATGDEESSGSGVRHDIKENFKLLDASICINEGGGIALDEKTGLPSYIPLQVGEKTYADFVLTANGSTGHSSVPLDDNAIYRLSKALSRMADYKSEARLIPLTRGYFEAKLKLETVPEKKKAIKAILSAKGKLPQWAVKEIDKDPNEGANLRTTCVATTLEGGTRVNALPSQAKANINCRILPDESEEAVKKRLTEVIKDPSIQITGSPINLGGAEASPLDNEVVKAVEKVISQKYPGVPIVPSLAKGATDSRFLRAKGMACYGFHPIAMKVSDGRRAHGIDERIQISSIQPGLEIMFEIAKTLATNE